jgi:hypothetical protein
MIFSLIVAASAPNDIAVHLCSFLNECEEEENKNVHNQVSNIQNTQLPSSQQNEGYKKRNVFIIKATIYVTHGIAMLTKKKLHIQKEQQEFINSIDVYFDRAAAHLKQDIGGKRRE